MEIWGWGRPVDKVDLMPCSSTIQRMGLTTNGPRLGQWVFAYDSVPFWLQVNVWRRVEEFAWLLMSELHNGDKGMGKMSWRAENGTVHVCERTMLLGIPLALALSHSGGDHFRRYCSTWTTWNKPTVNLAGGLFVLYEFLLSTTTILFYCNFIFLFLSHKFKLKFRNN